MATLSSNATSGIAPVQRHRRMILIGLSLWTILVVVALWFLLREHEQGDDRFTVVVHGGDISQVAFSERVRDWLRLAHVNFARIYPWILFGPYVFWLAGRFHLGKDHMRLNLLILFVGCAAFATACNQINSRVSTGMARVVVISKHQEADSVTGFSRDMQMVKMEVSGTGAGTFLQGEEVLSAPAGTSNAPKVISEARKDFTNWIPTNLLPKLEAMKPGFARSWAFTLSRSPLTTVMDLMAYASLAGIAHAVHFYRQFRDRERRALALESSLAQARLGALQAQLQPHFLFNTLNAIATLLRRDPKAAEGTLTSLSELLRLSLAQSDSQEITLREELRFLDRYLEIQQTRFGDRLRFEQQVDPATLDCLVPTLCLQPLVENAIRHGIEPSGNPGLVRVAASKNENKIKIIVEDDGVGLASSDKSGNGIGLSNLSARLETLYGTRQQMEVLERPEGGVAVRIEIPFRLSPAVNGGEKP